jgi:hypothetical protein
MALRSVYFLAGVRRSRISTFTSRWTNNPEAADLQAGSGTPDSQKNAPEMHTSMTSRALQQAIAERHPPAGLIHLADICSP